MMANGSVKLSIYSTFKDDGTKKAEKAIESFAKKYGQLDKKSGTMKLDDATRSLVEQSVQADMAAAKWQGYSDKLAAAGKAVTKYASAEAGAAVAASIKLASDFEDGFAKVKTIMDKQAVPVETLKADILELSTATGKSATELSEATYQALSASVETSKVAGFVGDAVSLAKAGFTESATAVDTLTTVINAYKYSADDADMISNRLVQTQNKGKTTVDALAQSMGNVIPTAAAYNVNLDNLCSSYVILTKQGINTANATTAINGMLTELADEGSTVAGILRERTGKSFGQLMGDGETLGSVLSILNDHVEGNSEEFANLWGNVRASKGALAIANAGVGEFNQAMADMSGSTGLVDSALEDLVTPSGKANKAINALKNAGIELGEQYLGALFPALSQVSGMAQDFSRSFAEMDDGQKQAAASATLLAASAGPVLLGASKVAGGIGTLNGKLASGSAKLATYSANAVKNAEKAAAAGVTVGNTAKHYERVSKVTRLMGAALSGPGVAGFAAVTAVAAITAKGIYDTWKRSDEMTGATKRLADACVAGSPSVERASSDISGYGASARRASVDIEAVTRAQSELADSIEERNGAAQAEINRLQGARAVLEQYMNQTGLTAQEQGKLRDAVAYVNEQCGTEYQVIDAANGALADQEGTILDDVSAIDQYIAKKQEQIRVDALSANLTGLYKQQATDIAAVASATDDLKRAQGELAAAEAAGVTGERWQMLADNVAAAQRAYDEAQGNLQSVNASIGAAESQLGSMSKAVEGATMTISDLARARVEIQQIIPPAQLDAFCKQLEESGIAVESFNSLTQSQMMDLALAYDGSMQSIIAAAERMGVEVPPKARAAADGVTKALASAEPATQAEASKTAAAVLAAFETLAGSAGEKGRSASASLAAGIAAGEPAVSSAAGAISATASAMGNGDAYSWGNHLARNFAAGLGDGQSVVSGAASVIAETAKAVLGHSVPRKGPLREGGRGEAAWGEHAVENFARGMESRTGLVARASSMVAQAASEPLASMTFGAAAAGGAGYVRIDPADLAALGRTIARSMPAAEQSTTYMGNITMRERSDFASFIQDLSIALDMEAN